MKEERGKGKGERNVERLMIEEKTGL